MKLNYHKMLEEKIRSIQAAKIRPSLLLHSCCAPCSSYVIEYLSGYFDITVFFYNPNIHPVEEYEKRYNEQKNFIESFPSSAPVLFEGCPYSAHEFFEMAKGLEYEPERGRRCTLCFELRLEKTAKFAAKKGFDFYTTTLTISPHKDAGLLNLIGERMGEKHGIEFLNSDFKKNNGYKRSSDLSREYGLYRQDYCGCVFSKMERMQKGE